MLSSDDANDLFTKTFNLTLICFECLEDTAHDLWMGFVAAPFSGAVPTTGHGGFAVHPVEGHLPWPGEAAQKRMTCGWALSLHPVEGQFPLQVTGALPVRRAMRWRRHLPCLDEDAQRKEEKEMQAFLFIGFHLFNEELICYGFIVIIADSCFAVSQAVERILSKGRAPLYFALIICLWL